MFNYFSRSTTDSTAAVNTKQSEMKVEPQTAAPTESPVATAIVADTTVGTWKKADPAPRAPSPATLASPSEAQWYTCLDFVRVDGGNDTPTNGQPTEDANTDTKLPPPEPCQEKAPAVASNETASEEEPPLLKAKTDDSYDNDSEWQEVTMSAFRGDGPVDKTASDAQKPVRDSSRDSSSTDSDSEEDTAPTPTVDVAGNNTATTYAPTADPPAVGQHTILNIRAREQRIKEDQKKSELEALARAAEEQRNLLAAKALADAEAAHLKRAKEELEALAAEQARAVASALEEEDRSRRRQQDAADQSAPVPIGAEGSPTRLCDCLGASSGFHRSGCKLRK